jgi:hypothetical protein
MGYLSRDRAAKRRGRSGVGNTYQLQEKLNLEGSEGSQVGVASWKYIPTQFAEAIAELKLALGSGNLDGTKMVNIALTVNVLAGTGQQYNIGIANGKDVASGHLDAIKEMVGLKKDPDPSL